MADKINYTGSDKWKQKATELLNQESGGGGGGGSTTIISVGYHDSQYQTINAAIAYARTICSESARVLIEIAPGIYYENINLHPNPGIDLIGYGAHIINNSESYPEAALFTNHTGSFTGLYFENLVEGAYALHVERDSTDKSGGVITFTDCSFVSVYAGAGIGMSPGASIFMRNCLCQSAVTNAGLYLHNANTDGSALQGFHALNCQFVARSGEYPVLIDDAIGVYGNTGTSQLMLDFQGATGGVDKIIGVRDNPNTVDHDFTGKANLILKQESSGNYFPALNYYNSRYIVSGSQTSTSSEDEGINTYTFTYDDGTTSAFNVRNGSKGSQGIQGPKGDTGEQGIQGIQGEQGIQGVKGDTGDAAGFGTPTATVDANVGTPSVSITSSGPDTAKIFNFEFHNLKGEQGTIPDLAAETIDTIDTIQTEYPTLTAGDKVSALFGKIKKFLSDLKSKKSDVGHTHDDRYYTETEIDTKLNGKSNTGHTHDDRYYTESEVDTKLSGKVSKSGDTMTGKLTFNKVSNAIAYTGSKATYDMIKFKDNADDNYGNGITIGGGGLVVIGGGESADTMAATRSTGGSEELLLCNDGQIDFYTNCQSGSDSASHTYIDTSGGMHANSYNGYKFDISTNNTSDTWLLVMSNEKIQHRLASTLSVNYAESAKGVTCPYLPSGTDGRAYWNSLANGVYWYSNSGSPANMPARWGFVSKLNSFTSDNACDWNVIFYTQSSGAIYRRSGNADSDSGWVRIDVAGITKAQVTEALGYTPPTTNTTYSAGTGISFSGTTIRTRNLAGSVLYPIGTSATSGVGLNYIQKYSDSANLQLQVYGTGASFGITLWSSDERLKENIEEVETEVLQIINNIKTYSFDFKDKSYGTHTDVGLIAQQLKEYIPEAVLEVPQGKDAEYDSLYQIDANKIIPYLLKSIQELTDIVNIQQQQIDELKLEV